MRRGAWSAASGAAFSPLSASIMVFSEDHAVGLWDLGTGTRSWGLGDDVAASLQLGFGTFSPDGSRVLMSSSATGAVALVDARAGQVERVSQRRGRSVTAIAFMPDGRHALIGTAARTITLLDPVTGHELVELAAPGDDRSALAASPDGTRFVSGGRQGALTLWDLAFPERVEVSRSRAESALDRLQSMPADGDALLEVARYFALRGEHAWALPSFQKAQEAGLSPLPEEMASIAWAAGDAARAAELLREALAPATREERLRLKLMLAAAEREAALGLAP
jgi:hypothetical protein